MENEQKKLKKLRKKELISIIDELKTELQSQLEGYSYLYDVNDKLHTETFAKLKFLNDAQKEPLRCRRIVVGGHGVGKTTLIKELIQQQPNVIVVGFDDEWKDQKNVKMVYPDSLKDLKLKDPENFLYVVDGGVMMQVVEREFYDWFTNNICAHNFIISFCGKRIAEAFLRRVEVDYMYLFEDNNFSLEDFKSLPKISTIFCDNYLKKQSDAV